MSMSMKFTPSPRRTGSAGVHVAAGAHARLEPGASWCALQAEPASPLQAAAPKQGRWLSVKGCTHPPRVQSPSEKLDIAYLHAFQSADIAVKDVYLDQFNAHSAPRLMTEEAALERLAMKHAYLKLSHGRELAFGIRRTLTGQAVCDYAQRYVVASSLVDREHGVVAYLLQPQQVAPKAGARTILLFRGTNPVSVMDPLCQKDAHPEGLAADADPQGVAYAAFAHNAELLQAWVRSALQAGSQVTITGHSLGGALAARTVACLIPEEQACTHAVTFNAPGLDAETANRVVPQAGMRLVRMRRDPISKGGQKHPCGTIIKQKRQGWLPLFSILLNHTTATLSSRELDGKGCEYILRQAHWTDTSAVTEALRVKVGETMVLPP